MKSESEVRNLLTYFRQESVALEEKRTELLNLLNVPKDEAVLKRLQELADFMPNPYYQPLPVLDIMPVSSGIFQVRTIVGWAMLSDHEYKRMIRDSRTYIESIQYGEGGAGLPIRFIFSPEQIQLIAELI